MKQPAKDTISIEFTEPEVMALFAAVNYTHNQISDGKVHTYVTILTWAVLYPQLIERLDKLRYFKVL